MPSPFAAVSRSRGARLVLGALILTAGAGAASGFGRGAPPKGGPSDLDGRLQTRLAQIHSAAAHGLDPADYGADAVAAARARGARASDLDALLDDGLGRLRQDLAGGATPPAGRPEPYRSMEGAEGAPDDGLPLPVHPEYQRLVEWLAVYEARARDGGWPAPGPAPARALRVGESGPAVIRLRARLAASVDPQEARAAGRGNLHPATFDPDLETAVRLAQARLGLEPDGVVGEDTWAALSEPVEQRVQALRTTLEQWRWLPRSFGTEMTLWIDVPSFELAVVEGGGPILRMPVVVGAPDTPTPPLADTLESVVVHPEWNVPESILLGELAPAEAADPGHLTRGGYDVLDGSDRPVNPDDIDWSRPGSWPSGLRVRQRPGPTNALGAIKFLFPNHHAVYLHDSPARHLYTRADRALSHGCVRLSDPWALAELLAGRGVLPLDVAAARRAGTRTAASVRGTVPVFFTHFAARADRPDRAPRFPRPLPAPDLSGAAGRI